jgi:hypothetical protein
VSHGSVLCVSGWARAGEFQLAWHVPPSSGSVSPEGLL